MSTPKILVEAVGPVTTIIINRPQARNALDNEAAHGLAAALRASPVTATVTPTDAAQAASRAPAPGR